ncbi:hypothetical protein [Streptomyces sp. NBRC 110035]|uniref:hypothetical protein n=1 Tax=Streptomyces sp. NBRC 110035 TaxID=1547867 RepID=UPI0005AB662D|nr:hypothetical protein [Streptomyces sp. NBRC 110035]
MAAPTAPTPHNRIRQQQGRFLLGFARLVQRVLAHRRTRMDVALRNRAMRAAHAHGIVPRTIAREVGLSGETTRQVLRGEPVGE